MKTPPSLCRKTIKRHHKRLPVLIVVLSLSFGYPSSSDTVTTVYAYRQSKGTAVDTVFRSITQSPQGTIIDYENLPDEHSQAVCDSDFRISSWHYKNKETGYDVNAARSGDTIRLTGRKGTKTLQKAMVIDTLPWYQALEFSLLPFFRSGAKECTFWMIRPTDMNSFKMIVQRGDTATIQVNGRPEQALHITLSPSGLSGRFWKASYWYRTGDYSFLKIMLPSGLPGLAPVIVESINR